MADFQGIIDSLKAGKAKEVEAKVQAAIDEGTAPEQILSESLIKGMAEIGVRFKAEEIFVPEVLIAARAMKSGMVVLKPLLASRDITSLGTIIVGTVKGDLHDIGKNLVCMMLEGAGFEVVDIGIDVPPEMFIDKAREHNASIIGISSLLTTTMLGMKDVIDCLKASDLAGKVKTMVGGAPVTKDFADQIGADGYSDNASEAVDLAKSLIA